MKRKIQAAGGPDPEAWNELVDREAPARLPTDDEEPVDDSVVVTAAPDAVRDMADSLMRQAKTLQREVAQIEETEARVRCTERLAGIITQLGKITGAAMTNERTILMSPAFRSLVDVMIDALAPWPDALHAVSAAMESRRVSS
jgi:hypothetical protein